MRVCVKGTKTISFIEKEEVPKNLFIKVTYSRVVCDMREVKPNKNRTRLTVGRDRIKYTGNCVTPKEDLLAVKLLLDIVISTLG